ncbi:MAG TPA: GntR family transcriptional regulator [Trueperaceae bacterium]|nr:GntR family transcriptional regulator [Trueperaceae bacterium]
MTKVELVYRSLREEIMVGTLQPGERLLFADLARRYGVSAIPVREAVRQLESEDLVEFKPHTRVEVKALPFDDGVWASEVRAELEPLAARLATPHVTTDRLERLSQLVDEMGILVVAQDHTGFVAHYNTFFDTLYAVTPNRTLVEMINEVKATSRRFSAVYSCNDLHRGSEGHLRGVFAALAQTDAQTVGRLVRSHRLWALDAVRSWVGLNSV